MSTITSVMSIETEKFEALRPYYRAALHETMDQMDLFSLKALEARILAREQDYVGGNNSHFITDIADNPDVAVIAEHKRKSPNAGIFDPASSSLEWVEKFEDPENGGPTAFSILTQKKDFGGLIDDIAHAASGTDAPILRKDFIEVPYQLYQAKAVGADAVLLIVAGLDDGKLKELHETAKDINLDCLFEVHNERELDRAFDAGAYIVGINNRDLTTGEVDLEVVRSLLYEVPEDVPAVAESGYDVDNPEHIRELRELGASAVLMGTSLMEHEWPADALYKWLATDRTDEFDLDDEDISDEPDELQR